MPQTIAPLKGLSPLRLSVPVEDFLARLTDAAYRVSLKHGFQGSFLDVQLELWSALRGVVARSFDLHGQPEDDPPVL
jgi:hypothetical protein